MADKLASIFGTEKDKVNCPFYFKIGACRHGDQCSRLHNRPTMSETILLKNMYDNPAARMVAVDDSSLEFDDKERQKHFEEFYEDVFVELSAFGDIDLMQVCDNVGDHLIGNVYVKFFKEEDAEKALKALQGRFYAARPIMPEFSPVTDFREARCRQFDLGECSRGGYCNFMHLKEISAELRKRLYGNRKRTDGGDDYHSRRSPSRRSSPRRRSPPRYDRDRRRDDRDYRRDDRDHRRDDYRRDRERERDRDRERDYRSSRDDRAPRGDYNGSSSSNSNAYSHQSHGSSSSNNNNGGGSSSYGGGYEPQPVSHHQQQQHQQQLPVEQPPQHQHQQQQQQQQPPQQQQHEPYYPPQGPPQY